MAVVTNTKGAPFEVELSERDDALLEALGATS